MPIAVSMNSAGTRSILAPMPLRMLVTAHAGPDAQAVEVQWTWVESPRITYWPVVHAVAGEASTPVIAVRLIGGVDPVGVNVPGVPAVAPVATGPPTGAEEVASPKHTAGLPSHGRVAVAVSVVRASPPIAPEVNRTCPMALGGLEPSMPMKK